MEKGGTHGRGVKSTGFFFTAPRTPWGPIGEEAKPRVHNSPKQVQVPHPFTLYGHTGNSCILTPPRAWRGIPTCLQTIFGESVDETGGGRPG